MKQYLVFDWGGTFFKYALMNENAEIIEKGKVPSVKKSDTKEVFFSVIDQIVQKYAEKAEGIAISSPGIIDSFSGKILVIGNFPYLNQCNIKEVFEQRYRLPVSIENDAKSAALAEVWKGHLQGVKDGAVLIIGTSIGGGIVLDGKLRRGIHFSAGEYSSASLDVFHPCETESYFGFYGVKGLARLVAKHTGDDPSMLDGETIFKMIQDGSEQAQKGLIEYCDILAMEIFSLNMILDLSRICIGGGISIQPKLLECLKERIVNLKNTHPDLSGGTRLPLPEVTVCKFYNDANLIGALYHHLYETGCLENEGTAN